MILLIIFGLILLFLWGLVEAAKVQDREEQEMYVDNRTLVVNVDGGETPRPLKKLNR